MKTSKLWTICLIFFGFIFIVAFSIALPIWFRPFYYMCIDWLNIEEYSGYSREQILVAYNDVLNYLNFGTPFKTGVLPYSEEAKSHFEDCKILFDLDTWALIISSVVLIVAIILKKKNILIPAKLFKFDWFFFSGITSLIIPIVLGGAIAVDFDKAFVVFHKIFFPGKDNWIFDWYDDHIIRILPSEFFMLCGILIAVLLFVLAGVAIGFGISRRVKFKKLERQLIEK